MNTWSHHSLFQVIKANYFVVSYILILNTCPDQQTARNIADALVEADQAACVNILPAGLSIYRWQGKIESAEEHLLIIKTHEEHYPHIETVIQNLHPYELPEIIAVPVIKGLPDYLTWIGESVKVSE